MTPHAYTCTNCHRRELARLLCICGACCIRRVLYDGTPHCLLGSYLHSDHELEAIPFYKDRPAGEAERQACGRELTKEQISRLVIGPKVRGKEGLATCPAGQVLQGCHSNSLSEPGAQHASLRMPMPAVASHSKQVILL
jgi:hypothetical protein